ncbi:MAG: hypothetical protein ACR2KV_17410 [Solirubrobacteraceae bacterium]
MNRKLITASAAAAVLIFGASSATAASTIIGSTGQSNSQGANSTQSGSTGGTGGSTFILGDSAPTTVQDSTNVLTNEQEIGGDGTTTLIAPAAGQCFCQSSQQGVNSQQTAVTGDGGGSGTTAILGDSAPTTVQTSTNVLDNEQSIGDGATILIGGASQVNQQGANSSQSGQTGGAGGTGILVVGGDSLGLLDQTSSNVLTNEVVLGG